jgi:hypothetical protein
MSFPGGDALQARRWIASSRIDLGDTEPRVAAVRKRVRIRQTFKEAANARHADSTVAPRLLDDPVDGIMHVQGFLRTPSHHVSAKKVLELSRPACGKQPTLQQSSAFINEEEASNAPSESNAPLESMLIIA